MAFFAILCALLLEQARPLARRNALQRGVRGWARWTSRQLDAGRAHHGGLAWAVSVGLPAALVLAVYWISGALVGWPLAMLWDITVLYATLGFRQFSHHFMGLRDALGSGDEACARGLLADWQQVDLHDVARTELVRHVIESSLLSAHRRVFGVLGWYSVLAALGFGPVGAVIYRLSEFVARYWRHRGGSGAGDLPASPALQRVARDCWHAVDWLPARMTALSFAVVGRFEAAIDGWRTHARQHPYDNDGVVLAASAGALDVRLGGAVLRATFDASSSQALEPAAVLSGTATQGRAATVARLPAVAALVWRGLVMWLVLLALLTLARLLG